MTRKWPGLVAVSCWVSAALSLYIFLVMLLPAFGPHCGWDEVALLLIVPAYVLVAALLSLVPAAVNYHRAPSRGNLRILLVCGIPLLLVAAASVLLIFLSGPAHGC